jgi:hypothetical protein
MSKRRLTLRIGSFLAADSDETRTLTSGTAAPPLHPALRLGRRIGIGIAGAVVILAGSVMLVTPGPGVPLIVLGLGILSLEFDRPRAWLAHLKARGVDLKERLKARRSQ